MAPPGLRNVAAPRPRPAPPGGHAPARVAKQSKESIFFKTVMCRFYRAGCCDRGRDCTFAHRKTERTVRPDLSKTKMCPMLKRCVDPNCTFAHNRDEILKLDADALKALKSEPVKKLATKQEIFDFGARTEASAGPKPAAKQAFDFEALASAAVLADAALCGGREAVLSTAPVDWSAALAAAPQEKILTHSSLAPTSAASSLAAEDSESGDSSEEDPAPLPEEARPVYLCFDDSGALVVSLERPILEGGTMRL